MVAVLLTITLVGVIANQVVAITRKPSISPLPTITRTENITPNRIENASTSPAFTPILWFYVSGYRLPSYLSGRYGVSEINDEQTWSAFWSQVSANSLPQINFHARTVLLATAPIFPFGTFQFNVTRVFKTDSPLPGCTSTPLGIVAECVLNPPTPTLHIEVDGRTTAPGPNCVFLAIVTAPRYLVEVLEIHKTTLQASLNTTIVQVPCTTTDVTSSTSMGGCGATNLFQTLDVSVTLCVIVLNNSPVNAISPTGTVLLRSNSTGSFSGPCILSGTVAGTTLAATCTVTYTPSVPGWHRITANYPGDSAHTSSGILFDIYVKPSQEAPPSGASSPAWNG